jgi:hypothetical protein
MMSTRDCADTKREPDRQHAGWPYWRVLIATWGGRLPAWLINYASATVDPAAMFHVVAALASQREADPDAASRARCQASNMIQAACNLLVARGHYASGELLTLPQPDASSASLLAHAAANWGTDLVLTSWQSPAHVARFAHCPVLMLPDTAPSRYGVPAHRFFVASDDSDASSAAIDEVARIMNRGDDVRVARVVLDPHAAPPPNASDAVVLQAAGHGGNLAHSIASAALAWRADLLVLGTHAGEPFWQMALREHRGAGRAARRVAAAARAVRRSPPLNPYAGRHDETCDERSDQ